MRPASRPGNEPRFVTNVRSFGERSIQLLDLIELTISGLCAEQALLNGLASAIQQSAEAAERAERTDALDPEGEIETLLLTARQKAAALNSHYEVCRQSAQDDPTVREEDGLSDEFEKAAAGAANLHNALNRLVWAVGEHDADLDKPSDRSFTNVDDLIAAMEA